MTTTQNEFFDQSDLTRDVKDFKGNMIPGHQVSGSYVDPTRQRCFTLNSETGTLYDSGLVRAFKKSASKFAPATAKHFRTVTAETIDDDEAQLMTTVS